MANVHLVVLAGGAGTRFWPAGRATRPKQLLAISSERTMLAETLARCSKIAPPARTWIVTNAAQADATLREAAGVPPGNVIPEPHMRNTAAAIGLAATLIEARDPGAVMVVVPADHVIGPQDVFEATFAAAVRRAAEAGTLLTVGIRPTGPATGYGYIEAGERTAEIDGHPVHAVKHFKEKPDRATAAEFVKSGRYTWNSGTFVWRTDVLLEAFRLHLPAHAARLESIGKACAQGHPIPDGEYAGFENVPIDIGIMEKAKNVEVIPARFDWDDVGSWLALMRLRPRDEHGNVTRGENLCLDTENCIVIGGEDHLVATLGVSDLIVVHTEDATLVCPRSRAEEVRRLVARLREEGRDRWV